MIVLAIILGSFAMLGILSEVADSISEHSEQ